MNTRMNAPTLNARAIRHPLLRYLYSVYNGLPNVILCSEFCIRKGLCYADHAVLHNALHGFEIKSDADNLARLDAQIQYYNEVFDFATLIAGPKHANRAYDRIPPWWGFTYADHSKGRVELERVRLPRQNPHQHIEAITALLWRDEALTLLNALIPNHKLKYASRRAMYRHLVENVEPMELKQHVNHTLRERSTWTWRTDDAGLWGCATRKALLRAADAL